MLALGPLRLQSPRNRHSSPASRTEANSLFSLSSLRVWPPYVLELLTFSKPSLGQELPHLSQLFPLTMSPHTHTLQIGVGFGCAAGGVGRAGGGGRGAGCFGGVSLLASIIRAGIPTGSFAFRADRSSLLIDYLIIDFPRSQCGAVLAGAPPDWPSPPLPLPTEIWVSSFSSRPQGEFSARLQLQGGGEDPAPSRASCEPSLEM